MKFTISMHLNFFFFILKQKEVVAFSLAAFKLSIQYYVNQPFRSACEIFRIQLYLIKTKSTFELSELANSNLYVYYEYVYLQSVANKIFRLYVSRNLVISFTTTNDCSLLSAFEFLALSGLRLHITISSLTRYTGISNRQLSKSISYNLPEIKTEYSFVHFLLMAFIPICCSFWVK